MRRVIDCRLYQDQDQDAHVVANMPIIIIIARLSKVSEGEWGDLKCLYKVCQTAITDGGLFTDTGVDERSENER